MLKPVVVLTCSLGVAIASAQAPAASGPRFRGGAVPEIPTLAVSSGEVLLDVALSATGRVTEATPIRSTPPFTDATVAAVRGWEFVPPEDEEHRPIPSRVLVGALFRAPSVYATPGDASPADIGRPSQEIPYPLGTVMPVFPPQAHGGGVVLLEALIDPTGGVNGVRVIRSAPPFDGPAEAAARRWLFRPAYVASRAESRYAYLVFAFPSPIAAGRSPR